MTPKWTKLQKDSPFSS